MSAPLRPATYSRTVRGTGPGLVLAHGAGGAIGLNFGPIMDELAAGHTVVGVDLPGAGDTPRSPSALDADAAADELVAAADAEGLESFAVAGWSLGAALAIHAAARHPDRIGALVLTSPFARADARLDLAASIWKQLYERTDNVLVLEFLMLVARGTQGLEAMSAEQRTAAAESAAPFVAGGTAEHVDLVRRIDIGADLPGIRARTLVIVTADDRLVSPALQRRVADGIPGASTATLETGHLAFMEAPGAWSKLITGFLAA